MAGQTLTTTSTLLCPHGGQVQISSGNTAAMAGGAPLALATDTFTVSGCPFQIPAPSGTVPSPCVTVQWVVTDVRTRVNGLPTLSTASVGLCLAATMVPQGNVVIVTADPKITSQ